MNRPILRAAVATLVLAGVLFAYLDQKPDRAVAVAPLDFDRVVWNRGASVERRRMAIPLLESKALFGLPRSGVLELLGEPLESKTTETRATWALDEPASGLSVFRKKEFLVIEFDTQERVLRASISRSRY